MEYKESPASKQLYKLNKRLILFEKAPYLIKSPPIYIRLYGYLYLFLFLVRNYVFQANVFEKKKRHVDEYTCENKLYYNKLPKVVVYTCITGGYDELLEPIFRNNDFDYYVVTDMNIPTDSVWKKKI